MWGGVAYISRCATSQPLSWISYGSYVKSHIVVQCTRVIDFVIALAFLIITSQDVVLLFWLYLVINAVMNIKILLLEKMSDKSLIFFLYKGLGFPDL